MKALTTKEYLDSRRLYVLREIANGKAYSTMELTNPCKLLDGIFNTTYNISERNIKFIEKVISLLGTANTPMAMSLPSSYMAGYCESIIDIAEDLFAKAECDKLNPETWFEDYALSHDIISIQDGMKYWVEKELSESYNRDIFTPGLMIFLSSVK